ncbi:DUF4292 domain-containing protein [Chitinophagaceae bacterium LB-8]|uniref:DUF4292 domain-containing protein n=1 Tax=Paraflavisolibacter caeni TaxID=2982496 RepID=A0A9X3B7E5_9BACT|nr:DUF4292 domain-containing protein [Paraflavisolibacter caeni]MCU7548406.1 DUF4292 domain-containing protein [Paraflavisolibacter caeni]
MMRVLSVLLAVLLLASCRSTKKIQTAIAQKDTTEAVRIAPPVETFDSAAYMKSLLSSIDSERIDFKTFSAKINVDYRDASDKKYDLNVNVRMQKDSVIWMSVNAVLGIEAIRLMVTKDSVKMLNKQDKVYTVRSIDYLQEITTLPLNLTVLQDLIIGNVIFLDSNLVSFTKANDNTISLLSLGKWFKNMVTINENDKKLLRSKLDDADITRSRTADLTYNNYENKNGVLFAEKRKITVVEKKKLDVGLEFKQYEFNGDVNFPFSIPKNYKHSKI